MLEMIASTGDACIAWFEYDQNSSILEKPLKLEHIWGEEDDFIHKDVDSRMGLSEIAHNVKINLKRTAEREKLED